MDSIRVALLREVLAGTEWLETTRRFARALRASVKPHGGGLLLVGSEAYEPWHLAAHLDDEAAWSGRPELSPTLVRHRTRPGDPAHLTVGLGRIEAVRRGETLLVATPHRPEARLLERVHDARRAGATVLALDSGDRELHALAHDALAVSELLAEPLAVPGPEPEPEPGGPPSPARGDGFGHGSARRDGIRHSSTEGRDGGGASLGFGHVSLGRGGFGHESLGYQGFGHDTVQHLVSAAAGENCPTAPRGQRRFRDRLSRLAEYLLDPPPARW
jgi:hypothetical protein